MKLSIVTVNKNNGIGLEKTILSVINQTFNDFEYIVIDGCSTDTSVEVINKYSSRIKYWVSESDTGIYNAMNKGIKRSKGEYCLFLNSGDCLLDTFTLERLFSQSIDRDIVYTDIFLAEIGFNRLVKYPDILTPNFFWRSTLAHQAAFIKKNLFLKVGMYNEDIKITADHDFFLKAVCLYNATYQHFPTVTTIYDLDGISSKPDNRKAIEIELDKSFREHFSPYYEDYSLLNSLLNEELVQFFMQNKNSMFLVVILKIIRKIYRILRIAN